jgi:hypothetical protein
VRCAKWNGKSAVSPLREECSCEIASHGAALRSIEVPSGATASLCRLTQGGANNGNAEVSSLAPSSETLADQDVVCRYVGRAN